MEAMQGIPALRNLLRRARSSGFLSAAVLGVVVVLLAVALLTTVSRLRMYELRDSLQAFNEKSDDLRNVSLLSRISLIAGRAFAGQSENAGTYRQEAEGALIAIRQGQARVADVPLTDRAALPVLNVFNFITGLPRLSLGRQSEQEIVLDLAFRFETQREYAKAIHSYEIYLKEFSATAEERDFALLHRGFCRAMLGEFETSLKDFEVVKATASPKALPVAEKLIGFIRALTERIRSIESVSDPARRGELYYNAAAYVKALENFALVDNARQSDKVRFLTARSLEETGRAKEAVSIYRSLVASGQGGNYAVNANRRMYMLGTFFADDKELAKESKKNSETVVRDREFMSTVTHLEKSAVKLHEETAVERKKQDAEIATRVAKVEEPVKTPVVAVVSQPVADKPRPAVEKPRVVAEPNLRDERVAKRAETLETAKKERLIRKQAQKVDKLTMSDGNVFFGVIYKEDAQNVFLYSVLGNLQLPKSDIRVREKVEGQHALKK